MNCSRRFRTGLARDDKCHNRLRRATHSTPVGNLKVESTGSMRTDSDARDSCARNKAAKKEQFKNGYLLPSIGEEARGALRKIGRGHGLIQKVGTYEGS